MPKRKVTKEKGSTNAAPLRAAGRFPAALPRVGPAYWSGKRSVRARPRARVSIDKTVVQEKIHEIHFVSETNYPSSNKEP